MDLQAMLAAFLLITNALIVLSQTSDPECLTPTNRNGFCVSIERCRNIYNIINDPMASPKRAVLNYIEKAACTLPGVARSVCCQPVEVNPAPTTTTTTTTSSTTTTSTTTAATPIVLRMLIGTDLSSGAKLNWSLLPKDRCGVYMKPRIAHGNETAPFEFPWMVLLMYQSISTDNLTERCGGSLINNRYVLTAAHCVKTSSWLKLVKVRLGEHNKNTTRDCIVYQDGEEDCADPVLEVDIEEAIFHKNFNQPSKFRHDIGLIRMAVEVDFSPSVMPICLPVDESVKKSVPPKHIITGWGTTENQTTSHVLLQALVNHFPILECQQKMGMAAKLEDPWQMCAMGEDMAGTCGGDSGGPLGFSVSVSGSPRFVQFGVVSAGLNSCGVKSMPGIYTRVPAYMDWIVANMRP